MSENVVSSVTQIPSIAEGVIQTQSQSVQSTARNEPVQSQSQPNSSVQPTRRLKRDRSSKHVTLSVDETGREILTCNFCQNVIHVGGEMASCEKVTSNACFTIPEEEEEEEEEEAETAVRNVKARLVQEREESRKEALDALDDINEALDDINECLAPTEKLLLGVMKDLVKLVFSGVKSYSKSK
ncbi:uncharacterized protein LOC110903508 [Helianthus annuus]|nr:uncharacterized protein LOC110903508 [Helianthus annuus]